jgi:hypothetical protein
MYDLAVEIDFASGPPDLSVVVPPPDLSAPPDLLGCGGGYLNSDAGDACPLSCGPGIVAVADEGRMHIAFGTPVTYLHNPPASGTHWPYPAPWGVHTEIVAREWWVHNLEHQGIVLLYNCPGGDGGPDACGSDVAQLIAIMNGRQPDVFNEVRILLTPDEVLPTRFAAVAWDWVWSGDTLDVPTIECFIDARYGRGPEMIP